MSAIGYYPGCSLTGSGLELDLSIRAIAQAGGVELREIDDWNCCGASAAHSLNHDLAVALPYRVLALASQQGLREVLVPCAACFSRLKGTAVRIGRRPELAGKMARVTGRQMPHPVRILNISEFIDRLLDAGLAEKLPRKLTGLKVAAYYGCLLSRGEDIVDGEDPEQPSGMDSAIRCAGCEPVAWNHANECCGGGFSMSLTDAVVRLADAILTDAEAAGADAIVTGCPMCHSNLDMRQQTVNAAGLGPHDMPVLYLSELLGLAAGLEPESLGLGRHFVDAMRVAQPAQAGQADPEGSA